MWRSVSRVGVGLLVVLGSVVSGQPVVGQLGDVAAARESVAAADRRFAIEVSAQVDSPVLSPSGTWRAVLERGGEGQVVAVWRSNDGIQWSRLPLPSYCWNCSWFANSHPDLYRKASLAIDDNGRVVVARNSQSFIYADGAWTVGEWQPEPWWLTPVSLVMSDAGLVVITNDGAVNGVKAVDPVGSTASNLPGATLIGDTVFVPTTHGLRRWSVTTWSFLPVTNAPIGAVVVASIDGSTSKLWAASDGGLPVHQASNTEQDTRTWSLWRSEDAGATWAVVVDAAVMPSRNRAIWSTPRWSTDKKWHIYGSEWGGPFTHEVTFDPATRVWGVPQRIVADLVFPNQLADGSMAPLVVWSGGQVAAPGVPDPFVTSSQMSTPTADLRPGMGLSAPRTSPSGAWTVVTGWDWNAGEYVIWRTAGDGAWLRITLPARLKNDVLAPGLTHPPGRPPAIGVLDDGTVVAIAVVGPWLATRYNMYRFDGTDWFGPTTTGGGPSGWLNDQPIDLAVGPNGRMAMLTPDGLALFLADGRRNWGGVTAPTTISPESRVRIVGDIVHVVGPGGYWRFSWTDGAALVDGQPALPLSPTTSLLADPTNPNRLLLVDTVGGLVIRTSLDSGATFGPPSAPEPLPRGMVDPLVSVGPDGRIHLVAAAQSNYASLIYSTTHALGTTPGFTPIVNLYLSETSAGLGDITRLAETASGMSRGEVWIQTYDDVSDLWLIRPDSVASAESVFGWDGYGWMLNGVNTAIGSFTSTGTDATIATVGPPLQLSRTYNSADNRVGMYARGWTSSFETRLYENIVTKDVVVLRGDGRREYFTSNGAGYVNSPGYTSTLVSTGTTGWTLTALDGSSETFRLDGRLVARADSDGRSQISTWDASDRLTKVTDVTSGRSISLAYTGSFVSSVSTSSVTMGAQVAPLTWRYTYSGTRLSKVCEPRNNDVVNGNCQSYGYSDGVITSITDANGRIDRSIGYSKGKVAWEENAVGDRTTFTYTRGRTVSTNELGASTTTDFDDQYRLTSLTDPAGGVTRHVYDAKGFRWKTTDPNGLVTTRVFDAKGNVTAETNGAGNTVRYTYDSFNNVTAVRDPRSVSAADATFVTTSTWDGAKRRKLSETSPKTAQQPAGTTTRWTYTSGGEAAIGGGVVPPGLLASETDANGRAATYRYDAAGNLREQTDRSGLLTRFTYDELGRRLTSTVVSSSFPAGVTTSYTYDGAGNVTVQDDPVSSNRVSGVAKRKRTTVTFDKAGNRTRVVEADVSGSAAVDVARTTVYGYDAADRLVSVTDPEGGVTLTAYDVAGNVVRTTDPRGVVRETTFDLRGLPTRVVVKAAVTDAGAAAARDVVQSQVTYDAGGRMVTSTDALGRVTRFAHDGANRVVSKTLVGYVPVSGAARDVVLEATTFDAAGNPTVSVTGGGLRREVRTFDAASRLTSVAVDPLGVNRVTSYVYDANGNPLVQRVARSGRTEETRLAYDAGNRVVTKTVENGAVDLVTTYTYDNRGVKLSEVEPRGNVTGATAAQYRVDFESDEMGRVFRITSPPVTAVDNAVSTPNVRPQVVSGFDTFGQLTDRRDERGNVTKQTFDRLGRVTRLTHPVYTPPSGTAITPTEQFSYDRNGNTVSKTDRRGRVTTFVFDGLNRVVSQTDPRVGTNAAGVSTVVYDDAGNKTATVDQRGARTEATYDMFNRVRSRTAVVRVAGAAPARHTSSFDYDDLGNVVRQQTPTGDVSTATYSALGERVSATDPSGAVTRWTYDAGGRVVTVTDPLSRATTTDFDLAGRPTRTRWFGPTGTLLSTVTASFDAAGNRVGVVSPRGNVTGATAAAFTTTFTYDVLSRLVRVSEPTSATASMVTSYGYDVAGNQTQLTDGRGNVTSYSFNSWGLQSGVVEPSTTAHPNLADRSWTTTFDAGGLPVREAQPGGVVVTRRFDELGRLTSETGSGTGVVSATRSFGYDAGGVRTSVSSPAGVIGFVVDDRGLLTATTGPAAVVSSFAYDGSGRMVSRTDGAGTSTFGWDGRGLLRTATDPLTGGSQTLSYDAAGQLVGVAYAGGGSRVYGYDGLGRRVSDVLKTSAGVVSSSVTVGFDADSNVTSRQVVLPGNTGAGSNSYGYDNVGRLVSWTAPSGAVRSYVWDAGGNLTGNAGVAQSFDQRNRLVLSGSTTLGWSARGTLTSSKAGTAAAVVSVFDGLGRQTTSGAQVFVYDALDRVVSNGSTGFGYAGVEIDPVTVGDVRLARDPVGRLVAGKVGTAQAVLVGSDGHHDVTHLFTAAGAVSGSRLFDPFGAPVASGGTFGVPVGFQGDYTSPVTGDVWMGARWYRPGTATFTSRDTVQGQLVTPVSANRYTYAWADPLGMWDPDGRMPEGFGQLDVKPNEYGGWTFAGWNTRYESNRKNQLVSAWGRSGKQLKHAKGSLAAEVARQKQDCFNGKQPFMCIAALWTGQGYNAKEAQKAAYQVALEHDRAHPNEPSWIDNGGVVADGWGNFVQDNLVTLGVAPLARAALGGVTSLFSAGAAATADDVVAGTADDALRVVLGRSATSRLGPGATNSVGNGMGGAGEMSMVRTVGRGEKIADLVDEGKRLTFETGNEYALVKLANGERAIVSGGPTGIALSDDVTRVFAHSHPYHLPATGPSAADFGMLSAFGQRSSWLLEHGTLSRFGVR